MEALERVRVHASAWTPAEARVSLNVTLDACVVPSAEPGGCRVDMAHLVCLDDLLDQASCASIAARFAGDAPAAAPPADRWERRTADAPTAPRTWGLTDAAMRALEAEPPPGVLELQTRLARLFPEYDVCHQPQLATGGTVCERFVANAAVAGDAFSWHVDVPSVMPDCEYTNRERGKPLYVSALLYLDAPWPEAFDAETLFLDPPSGAGVFVRPRRGRVLLMDSDVTHRLSPPSAAAGRPRYSLVWKLVFVPRSPEERACIARPEWGRPTAFGSAARVEALIRQLPPRQPASDVPQEALPCDAASRKRPERAPAVEAAAATRPTDAAGELPHSKRRKRNAMDGVEPDRALPD